MTDDRRPYCPYFVPPWKSEVGTPQEAVSQSLTFTVPTVPTYSLTKEFVEEVIGEEKEGKESAAHIEELLRGRGDTGQADVTNGCGMPCGEFRPERCRDRSRDKATPTTVDRGAT